MTLAMREVLCRRCLDDREFLDAMGVPDEFFVNLRQCGNYGDPAECGDGLSADQKDAYVNAFHQMSTRLATLLATELGVTLHIYNPHTEERCGTRYTHQAVTQGKASSAHVYIVNVGDHWEAPEERLNATVSINVI